MALYEDFVDITIGGVDVSDYVVDYRRNESICEPGATFVLTMTRKKFDDSMLTISTAAEVDIKEKYPSEDRVLKGYVTSVDVNANDINMRVTGGDKYVLLHDYFIDQRIETNGESVAYWINYICELVGLSVQFDTYPGIATAVAEDGGGGTPLGMQRATEAIKLLERKGAVYTRYDSDLDKIVVYTLATSQPKVNITSDNITSFDRTEGTEFTRNVVKVWGGHHYDWLTGQEHQYLAVARKNMDELVVDQTSYIASPEIQTQMFASIIASRILTVTATLDDLVIAECAGLYPDVTITDFASISINVDGIGQSADRQITSLGVAVDDNGAKTTFVFGEKCPRVTFSPPPFYVYATSYSGGAAISYDAGDSFYTFNEGLPTGSTYDCVSIAANTYNQLMMVANQGEDVYKRSGVYGTWTKITVTDPSNDEGEHHFTANDITFTKVEKEAGYYNRFHLLANATPSGILAGQERWWVYWTGNFGYTWDSMQLYVPGSGIPIGVPSGLPVGLINGLGITQSELITVTSGAVEWNVRAMDMECNYSGGVTVLVSSPHVAVDEEIPDTIYFAEFTLTNKVWMGYWDGTTRTRKQEASSVGFLVDVRQWSCPTNRDIAYTAFVSNDGPTSAYRGGHTYVWKTIDGGDTWTKIHDALLIADSAYAFILSYTVNFDTTSSESEVRVAFNCFYSDGTPNAVYAKARFVNSNPTGSTNYTDNISPIITLTDYIDLLGAGEYFDGYGHNNTHIIQNFNPAWKNAVIDGVTWAGTGLYGIVRATSDNRWLDTIHGAVIVRLNFSTKTVGLFNTKEWRVGDLVQVGPRVVLCSARSSNSVHVASNLVTPSPGWGSDFATVYPYNDFNGSDDPSMIYMGFKGFPDYTYRMVDDSSGDDDTDFYPSTQGNKSCCQLNKQFDSATYHWCLSDTATMGDPDGFCYSSDGINWTQHWDMVPAVFRIYDFAWRTWE